MKPYFILKRHREPPIFSCFVSCVVHLGETLLTISKPKKSDPK